jgi:hypothetical protein
LRDRMPSALRKKIQSEDPRDSKQLTLEHDDKKPEPKSITGELSQRAEAIKESRVSEEVHDPEAEGAAPKRPAENDLFREAEAREIKRAERKARRKCSELKQALLEEEGKAPREDLTEAEERALRQELGVVDSAAIGKAELAKRSKAARVKALRDRLEEVQASLEGGGGALLAMFPSEEQDDWGEPEAEDEPKARNFRVIESEEEAESEEIEEAVRAKKQGKGSGGKLGGEEEIFFLDRKEVTPENGYWECERGCWVYLPNSVFEKGFARAKELLPCWVFRGKVEPELLLGEGKWKFLGSPPFKIAFVEKLPRPIRDLLAALHAQTRLANENGAPVRSEQGPAEGGADSAALKEAPEREAGSIENEPNGEAGNGKVRSEEGRGQSLGKVGRIDEDDKSNEGAVTRELNERESSIGSVRVEDDSGKNAALRREDEGERQGFRNIDEIVPAAPKTELELGAGDSSPGSIGHREILFLAAMADLFQSGIEDRPTLIGVLLGLESYMKGVRFGCILAGEGAIIDSSGSVFRGDDFARIQFFSTKPTNSENRNAGLAIGFLDVGRRLSHRESALLKRLLPVLSQLMGNVGKEEGEKKDAA